MQKTQRQRNEVFILRFISNVYTKNKCYLLPTDYNFKCLYTDTDVKPVLRLTVINNYVIVI